ncbi:hypothetical protein [Saccharopolyspora hattusasensis]|uniref:hypothetical protein n=1 Tax=Saccharopolyspora hattusasensis TaxID=1128679 RepID=UPI003D957199
MGYAGRDQVEHLALIAGDSHRISATTPVHVHHECLTCDVLRGQMCRCGSELNDAMRRFASQGRALWCTCAVVHVSVARKPVICLRWPTG